MARTKQSGRKSGLVPAAAGGGGGLKKQPRAAAVKKPHRFRSGTVALQNIRKYQKKVDLLLNKAPFRQLVREILSADQQNQGDKRWRVRKQAFIGLQTWSENYLVELFKRAAKVTIHQKHATVMERDIKLAHELGAAVGEPLKIEVTTLVDTDRLVRVPGVGSRMVRDEPKKVEPRK